MNNITRRILSFVCISCLILPLIGVNSRVKATSVSFALKQTSLISWKSTSGYQPIPSVGGTLAVPYGDTIKIDMNIINSSGDISALLSLNGKEGIGFHPYYIGVLKINGADASAAQYANFISGKGMSVVLSANNTRISLEAQSIGTGKNRLATDLKIHSSVVTQGQSTVYYEYAFHGYFSLPTKYFVNFYHYDGSLLSTQVLINSQNVAIPEVGREGCQLLGFNTKRDGTGIYLKDNIITSSIDLYAVFQRSSFRINYYVDDILFDSKQIEYGELIPELKAPNKEDYKFIEWRGIKGVIKDNRDVHAVYEKKDKSKTFKIRRKQVKEGSDLLEEIGNILQSTNNKKQMNKKYEITTSPNTKKALRDQILSWIWIPMIILGGMAIYAYKRKK